jgi:cystathionine beta-synthase
MSAALEVAKELKAGQRCVVILPDSIRNYMTKHLNDEWMVERGFAEEVADPSVSSEWWYTLPISAIQQNFPMTIEPVSISPLPNRRLLCSHAMLVVEHG